MRVEKDGFVLHLEGKWMEISNKYGVLEHGDVATDLEDIPEGYAEKALEKFIQQHSVSEKTIRHALRKWRMTEKERSTSSCRRYFRWVRTTGPSRNFPKRWYMAGGNFLYTSDSRFREITKSKYPISIHDRYEGRQGT